MNSLLGLALTKTKHSKLLTCQSVRTGSLINNSSVVCIAFNKGACKWKKCGRFYKCKGCGGREREVGSYTKKKWLINAKSLGGIFVSDSKIVHKASSIAINDNCFLLKFINVFLCLLKPPRPNTINRFQLVDTLQPSPQNSLSPIKSSAWIEPLNIYSDSLQIHLPMILRFETQLGYKNFKAFILLENLASALMDTEIINKKLADNLRIG